MEDNGEHDESNTEMYRESRARARVRLFREEANAAGTSRPRDIAIIRQTRDIV